MNVFIIFLLQLYHEMSRSRDGLTGDEVRQHPCFRIYENVMLKPLAEAKHM